MGEGGLNLIQGNSNSVSNYKNCYRNQHLQKNWDVASINISYTFAQFELTNLGKADKFMCQDKTTQEG